MKAIKLALLMVAIFPLASFAKEPENLGVFKAELIQYHDSGSYSQDQKLAIAKATRYLKQRLTEQKNQPSAKPFAIVLDIDETSLTDYPYLAKMQFGGTDEALEESEGKGENPVIQPTLTFYQYAKANNVAVFFVTARQEKYRAGTIKNLKNVGFKNWDGLVMMPTDNQLSSKKPFKADAREDIEKRGYDIVLNIGDQKHDLVGGHADKMIKMPNPYYFTG